jgi:HEAT repeat protein
VVEAVGHLGADAAPAVPALVKLVKGRVPYSRATAAGSLGRIGKPAREAVPALKELLKTGDGLSKAHAAVALWRITGEADGLVPVLTAALDDPALRRPTFPPPAPYTAPPASYPPPGLPPQPGVPRQPTYYTYYYSTPTRRPGSDALLAVIRALGEIGPGAKPAAAALRRVAEDAEVEVAKAAADALKRIL